MFISFSSELSFHLQRNQIFSPIPAFNPIHQPLLLKPPRAPSTAPPPNKPNNGSQQQRPPLSKVNKTKGHTNSSEHGSPQQQQQQFQSSFADTPLKIQTFLKSSPVASKVLVGHTGLSIKSPIPVVREQDQKQKFDTTCGSSMWDSHLHTGFQKSGISRTGQENNPQAVMEIVKFYQERDETNVLDGTEDSMNEKREHSVEHSLKQTGGDVSTLGHSDESTLLDLEGQISQTENFPVNGGSYSDILKGDWQGSLGSCLVRLQCLDWLYCTW
jgi:hypothetical protein